MYQKHPQSLALGLDFAPDFERIRREHSPIEINQIIDPDHPSVGVEYVECETLSELVEFLKNFKKPEIDSTSRSSASSELGWNDGKRILVLTKQTPVMEKFCADNDIEAEIHAWKLGGPSFVLDGQCVITDELI